jgi:2-polyprenyl-6-methoxyphenol hydroxylase-like FAD-dependent oxidoreductase
VLKGAGPEVREVAIYAGARGVVGAMPAHAARASTPSRYAQHEPAFEYGRALGREHLDARLLAAARRAGAEVWQPWRVEQWTRNAGDFSVAVRPERSASGVEGPGAANLRARILIAAHGSWDTGRLPVSGRASDFVAFKAHFSECDLPPQRMPLIAFCGGYAGLVTTDHRRASFACCIRRDALARARAQSPRVSAGEAVFAYVMSATPALRAAIGSGVREGSWLASGPLRPGIHGRCGDGVFTVGNAHAEAHPIVGEGIAMAVESACLLNDRLVAAGATADRAALERTARDYERDHRALFRRRMLAASAYAGVASRPAAAAALVALFAKLPALFSFCARWAGKTAGFSHHLKALHAATSSR